MNLDTPDVRYARSGDVSIAYQVVGEGPVDLLFVPFMINLVWAWEQPIFADFCRRAASFSRLILLDKRGTGMSDRPRDLPTLETRMDDIRAVMDDAGSDRAALLGAGSPGGQLCALFAATYPERVVALVLHNTWPRVTAAPGFPHGEPVEDWRRRVREARMSWGSREYQRTELEHYFPSFAGDPVFEQWHVNHERLAASPGAAAWFLRSLMETDIREVLPAISVPTLMLYHPRWRGGCVYMAERIPHAEAMELDVPDVSTWVDPRVLMQTRALPGGGPRRHRARAGADHGACSRTSSSRPRGRRSLATRAGASCWRPITPRFERSSRATAARRSAAPATASLRPSRARRGRSPAPIAPSRPSRSSGSTFAPASTPARWRSPGARSRGSRCTSARASRRRPEPCEVLVSSIVRDLAAGSSIDFEDRGVTTLRGVPGEWHLYATRLRERAQIG